MDNKPINYEELSKVVVRCDDKPAILRFVIHDAICAIGCRDPGPAGCAASAGMEGRSCNQCKKSMELSAEFEALVKRFEEALVMEGGWS